MSEVGGRRSEGQRAVRECRSNGVREFIKLKGGEEDGQL